MRSVFTGVLLALVDIDYAAGIAGGEWHMVILISRMTIECFTQWVLMLRFFHLSK